MSNLVCNIVGHTSEKGALRKDCYLYPTCDRCGIEYCSRYGRTFWTSSKFEAIKFTLGMLLLFVSIVTLVLLLLGWGNKVTCNQYIELGIPAQWKFWTGCMANHPKFGWIPVDEYFKTFNIYKP